MCFCRFVLWTDRGYSLDSTNSQVADHPTLEGERSARVKLLRQCSGVLSCQVSDHTAVGGGLSGPAFSDSSDRFQTGKLVVTMFGGPSSLRAWTLSVRVESERFVHNDSILLEGYKYMGCSCVTSLLVIPSTH
jgi:hypothetical protein